MSFFALAALINGIISTTLGFFVFLKNKKEKLNQTFTLFCLGVAVWSYAYYLWQIADNENSAYFWCRVLMAGAIFITITYLHFVTVLLNIYKQKRIYIILNYFIFFLFFLINIFSSLFVSHVETLSVFLFWPVAGLAFHPFLALWIFNAIYAAVLLFRHFKITEGVLRIRIGYILIGTIIGYVGGITNYFLWYRIPILPIGNISTSFYLAIVAYAILKYQLMNIKVIATQILAIAITLVTLVEIFLSNSVNEIVSRVIIFIITLFFAILLIRSVLSEVRRREEMERLAGELAITTKKLKKANKELKRLDQTKSEFISIASHQLRTPLTAIKGYGSMLLEGDFGEIKESKQKDAVETMVISNNRLINLVENLLNVSRIESGRMKYSFGKVDLVHFIEDVYETMKQAAEKKKLFLNFKKPVAELPVVTIDEEKIRQVLINFLDNAIKYTKEGGVTIEVYRRKKENDLVCCVADTGIGISKEDQERLFKKFSRGKDAFLVNTEGMGLGLYVANIMVKAHNGKLWVDSEGEGQGSKFCFSLPIDPKSVNN